jgi:RNA polymerase sigma factor (sigma-70 family)
MAMANDSSSDLQRLIDGFEPGDSAARRAFLEQAVDRLRRLAAKMLGESFPRLQAGHDLDSVVNETYIRLLQALEQTSPPTVQDFFRLAAHKIRQVLLDMAEKQDRINNREVQGLSTGGSADESALQQKTQNPLQLAMWTEFHSRVPRLPEDERQVFDMHYYLEISQAEIARMTSLPPRQVSRLWLQAIERLTQGFAAVEEIV